MEHEKLGMLGLGKGRPGKGREKGKGYGMGNKVQVTIMMSPEVLEETDAAAAGLGVARSVLVTLALREFHDARLKRR